MAKITRSAKEFTDLYLEEIGKKYSEDVKVRPKSESKLLKLVRPFAEIFNENFWYGYVTTIGSTIWVPDDWYDYRDSEDVLRVVAHEVIHVKQKKKDHPYGLHEILYLFPQSLSVLSLLSLLAIPYGPFWLLCLLFLVCLAPYPALWRYKKELEAYRANLLWSMYVRPNDKELVEWTKNMIVKNLSGPYYYFAWPFPDKVRKDLDKPMDLNAPHYVEIIEFLDRHGFLPEAPES